MFSNRIVHFLNFFDSFGYNSGSSRISQNPKLVHFICILQISLATFCTCFLFFSVQEYLVSLGLMEAISEILEYTTSLCTYWLIIFDSFQHRKIHHLFWARHQQITRLFEPQAKHSFHHFSMKIIEFFSIMVILLVHRLTMEYAAVGFAYYTLFKMSEIRGFYYMFCLEVVNFHLKNIEMELVSIKMQSFPTRARYYSSNLRRLKWVREYFTNIYQMFEFLNEMFGCSQVAVIAFSFFLVLAEANWIYIHFFEFSFPLQISKCTI